MALLQMSLFCPLAFGAGSQDWLQWGAKSGAGLGPREVFEAVKETIQQLVYAL